MNKLLSKIYWKMYPGINTKVVYLQRFLYGFSLSDDTVFKSFGLTIKYIDYDLNSDLQQWCDVINNSYDDCFYDIDKARNFLTNHPIFQNGRTVLFMKGSIPCATVSWGGYKSNPVVGGDYRIGVHNHFKGHGLGRMCIEYAYSRLADEGFRFGESIITIKRVPSLMLHFSLGFEPRYDMRFVTYKDNLKYINLIQRVRLSYMLYKYHKQYLTKLKKSFQ